MSIMGTIPILSRNGVRLTQPFRRGPMRIILRRGLDQFRPGDCLWQSNCQAAASRRLARKAFKTKEEKRLEAEERNRLSRITKALKNEIVMLEDRISSLEERKAENENILCMPDIHKDPQKIKQLNQELVEHLRESLKIFTHPGKI